MFGAVPASFILDVMKSEGYMEQLPLLETIPVINVKEEYLTSIDIELDISVTSTGSKYNSLKHIDHPGFTETRDYLASNGFIDKVTNCWNADSVLKPFELNGHLFEEGVQFPCATALGNMIKVRNKSKK